MSGPHVFDQTLGFLPQREIHNLRGSEQTTKRATNCYHLTNSGLNCLTAPAGKIQQRECFEFCQEHFWTAFRNLVSGFLGEIRLQCGETVKDWIPERLTITLLNQTGPAKQFIQVEYEQKEDHLEYILTLRNAILFHPGLKRISFDSPDDLIEWMFEKVLARNKFAEYMFSSMYIVPYDLYTNPGDCEVFMRVRDKLVSIGGVGVTNLPKDAGVWLLTDPSFGIPQGQLIVRFMFSSP